MVLNTIGKIFCEITLEEGIKRSVAKRIFRPGNSSQLGSTPAGLVSLLRERRKAKQHHRCDNEVFFHFRVP